jgi:hypothetical protein
MTRYYSDYPGRDVNQPGRSWVDVAKQMAFPKAGLAARLRVNLHDRELVLRSSPGVQDGYNEEKSQWLAHAVFGNILRKYLKGATAEILAQAVGDDGEAWSFVRVDRSDGHLSYHTAVKTDVGWSNDIGLPR